MIPQETIEQVRQASDIVDTLSEFIRLKKRGRNFMAVCPFHTEKTPSFSVSPEKQIFHCFGCGKGGSVITFLMEHESMSFVEAVKYLARKAGITIVEDKKSDYHHETVDRLFFANDTAVKYFQNMLKHPKYESSVYRYLTETRHLNDETIRHFKIGFAGEEWEGLLKFAAKSDIKPQELEKAGLALYSEKKKNYFDRFRTRLMFPIMNLTGKTVAFGGRTLKKGEPAKYVNSPETMLYIKSNILYGLNYSKDEIRKTKFVYIVEGYFDVVSMWQAGINNVVASSGTAFTSQQAKLLARYAEQVYLFFDADSAGRNAALRSVDALYDAGLEVKIIVPPEGEDPDSLCHKYGSDKIEELQHDAVGFIEYRTENYDRESAGIIGREKLIKELSEIGSKIYDTTRRTLFFEEAAAKLGVDRDIFTKVTRIEKIKEQPKSISRKHNLIEANLISLLFNNPGSIDIVFEKISADDFDSKKLSRLYRALIQQYNDFGAVDAKKLIDSSNDSEFISLISEIASTEWDSEIIEEETKSFIRQFQNEKRKKLRQKLQKELAVAEAEGNQEKADSLLNEIKQLR